MERLVRELDRDPAASLRRWQRGLAAVTIVAGAAAVIAWQAEKSEAKCARTDEAFTGVWDQTRRAELEQVYAVSGAPHAAESFAATTDVIDRWTDAWIDEQVALCEARRIGAATEEAHTERRACLDTRQGELRALLTVLSSTDVVALDRAPAAAESLTPIHACTRAPDLAELRHGADADVAKLDELRSHVHRGWVLVRLGRAQAASDLLAAVGSESAEELGDAGLHVATLHLRGAVAHALGHRAAAETTLHEAAVHAMRGGFEQLLVLVWIELADVLAEVPGRQLEAMHVLDQARAVIDHARIDEQRWRLAAARGHVAAAAGRPAEALVHHREALEQLDRTAERPWARIELLLATGELLAAGGDPAAALGYLQRAYDQARDRFGARHPILAEILLGIGDVRMLQGEAVEARTSWDRALALVTDAHGPSASVTTTMTLGVAARLRDNDDPTSALDYIRRARVAIEVGNDPSRLADALIDEGRTLLVLGRDVDAAISLQEAWDLRDAAWQSAAKATSTDTRRDAAARLLDATVLLARALSSDPASRERAVAHGRAAKALASEHGFELDPWVNELARRATLGASR
jgi:tetratricopeptide (TPR) repeat protein